MFKFTRISNRSHREVKSPYLVGQDTEEVMRVGMSRINLEYVPIKLLRLIQVAALMVPQCLGKYFGNGGHDYWS